MLKTITTLFLFSLPCSSFSQFNDSVHHYVRFASTGFINKTNNGNSYLLNNGANFNIKEKRVSINTGVSWVYGSQNHSLINNDFSLHGDIGLNKDIHKLYYWGLLNYDKSFSLKINYRLQAGVGVGFNILDSPSVWLNISDGVLYEQGDLASATGKGIYYIPRNSFRLSYHWSLKERFIIDGIHFFQPSLLNINDYIIQSTNNLTVKLKKWLSITSSVIYNKVNRTKRENLMITYGITMEDYF